MYRFVMMALAALTVVNAHAQTPIKAANRELNVSVGAQKTDYFERDDHGLTGGGSVLDSEKGTQPSVKLSYTAQGDLVDESKIYVRDLYFNMSYAYSDGKTQYDGYLQNLQTGALTPYNTRTKVSTSDFQMKIGKGFVFFPSKSLQITPYASYRWRSWKRDSSSDQFGYLEQYDHSAIALGSRLQAAVTPRLVVSLDGSVGRIQNANLTVQHELKFELGSKPIYTAGIDFDYALNNWHINAGYQYTRFEYGESPVVSGFFEPASRTTLYDLYAGASYGF
ncbi:MAG TPA: hypothetical protein VFW00_06490 [Rhodocyclaceae bacterium]|nr:hypothetical protein [Rhodocyclaceae bacterium]